MSIVYIGTTLPVDFELKWSDGSASNITGAKCWAVLNPKKNPTQSPPTAVRKNVAAGTGGSDTDVPITDATAGKFSAYFTVTDTQSLSDGVEYVVAGIVQIGTRTYCAGVSEFTASGMPPVA